MTRTQLVSEVLRNLGQGQSNPEVLEAIRLEMREHDEADAKRQAAGLGPYRYESGMALWLERGVRRRLMAEAGGR